MRARHPHHDASGESGAVMVEFALVLPLLLVVLMAIFDFGRALHYWQDETSIASVGARMAAVNRNPAGSGSLQGWVRGQGSTAELRDGGTSSVAAPLQVCVEFPNGSSNVGDPVRVRAVSTYRWLPFLGLDVTQTQLSGSATMRLEARPTNYSAGCA